MNRRLIPKKVDYHQQKKHSQRTILLIVATFITALITVVGTSYAVFQMTVKGSEQSVVAGTFRTKFTEGQTIQLLNASPTTEEEALKMTPYIFTITQEGTIPSNYQVKLEEDTKNTLPKDKIRFRMKKNQEEWSTPIILSEQNLAIAFGNLNSGESVTYSLLFWVDYQAGNEIQGLKYQAKIVIESIQNSETLPDTIPPTILLEGNTSLVLEKGSTFVDPGVSAVTDNQDTISKDSVSKSYAYYDKTTQTIVSTNQLDFDQVRIYFIYYQVKDKQNNLGTSVRVVNIISKNKVPPTLTLETGSSVTMYQTAPFREPGYHATDSKGRDISSRVVTILGGNNYSLGTYIAHYIVVDEDGNMAASKRTITVLASPTYSVTNLWENSSFEGTYDAWYNYASISLDTSVKKYGEKSLKTTYNLNQGFPRLDRQLSSTAGHILYFRYESYVDSPTLSSIGYFIIKKTAGSWSDVSTQLITGGTIETPHTWKVNSARGMGASEPYISLMLAQASPTGVGNLWFDGLAVLDLTAAFGSGNEPSKEWLDQHVPYFEKEMTVSYHQTLEPIT